MAHRNSYFQIIISGENTSLRIFPAMDGGQPLTVSEVADYLTSKGYAYDVVALSSAISMNSEQTVPISTSRVFPEQEMMRITVKENGLKAYARFYAPSSNGAVMDEDEIKRDLSFKKITVGIREDAIRDFVANRAYCTDILIAEGEPVREGHDASIEYLFQTQLDTKPTLNEDGSVDFFHLNTVCHCAKGQVLARLIKEDPGTVGRTVTGDRVIPHDVKKAKLQFGRNIRISEDRCEITSDVDGHVQLVNDTVFVSGVLDIQNVDTSTGHLEYDGDILVQGNVTTGFSVKTNGNVEVRGVVEGAVIEAGGNIIIARGINGMGRGQLTAGGNIFAKFIENATVRAGGNIETESILHSQVSAKVQVCVRGKKGFITGGVVRAGECIEVRTLGSSMGVDTVVEVGTDPEQKERLALLQKRIAETKKSIAATEPVLVAVGQKLGKGEKLPPEQMQRMQLLSKHLLAQKEQLKADTVEMTQLAVAFDRETNAVLCVMGEAHPGTHIIISEASMVLHQKYHYCRFIRNEGEVEMAPM